MTNITPDEIRKVENLARLELKEEEVETFSNQLEDILGYVAQIESIETDGIPQTTRAVEVVNVVREDKVIATDVRQELLEQAPEREDDFYRVPKILSD